MDEVARGTTGKAVAADEAAAVDKTACWVFQLTRLCDEYLVTNGNLFKLVMSIEVDNLHAGDGQTRHAYVEVVGCGCWHDCRDGSMALRHDDATYFIAAVTLLTDRNKVVHVGSCGKLPPYAHVLLHTCSLSATGGYAPPPQPKNCCFGPTPVDLGHHYIYSSIRNNQRL